MPNQRIRAPCVLDKPHDVIRAEAWEGEGGNQHGKGTLVILSAL